MTPIKTSQHRRVGSPIPGQAPVSPPRLPAPAAAQHARRSDLAFANGSSSRVKSYEMS